MVTVGCRSATEELGRLAEHGDGLTQRYEITTLATLGIGLSVPGFGARRGQLVTQPGVLRLQLHHAANTFEVHPLGRQLRDTTQHLDVGVGVPAVAALRARRVEQAAPLVLAQRLGMHARQLGRHRDHVHRPGSSLHDHHALTSARLASRSASIAARCSRVRSRGTATSIVTMRSPVLFGVAIPLPLTR